MTIIVSMRVDQRLFELFKPGNGLSWIAYVNNTIMCEMTD
jgi:hypothetical protein